MKPYSDHGCLSVEKEALEMSHHRELRTHVYTAEAGTYAELGALPQALLAHTHLLTNYKVPGSG